jgi:hypothetical protein
MIEECKGDPAKIIGISIPTVRGRVFWDMNGYRIHFKRRLYQLGFSRMERYDQHDNLERNRI